MLYSEKNARGYPRLFFNSNSRWKRCLGVTIAILALSFGFFAWCTHVSNDMGGDSFGGLVFAIGSTVFMFLAAVAFSMRRHSRQRTVSQLNNVLNWHVCFGFISLVMVFLHCYGNYNPRTGTYALEGMVALVISGIIGRILDRMMPRMMAREVSKVQSISNGEYVEQIWNNLRTSVNGVSGTERQNRRGYEMGDNEADGWDTAYQTRKGKRAGRLNANPQDNRRITVNIERTLQKEMFYRYVIRYWRVFHIFLAILTIGLTLWHIEYALALIIPTVQKYGIGYLLPWP